MPCRAIWVSDVGIESRIFSGAPSAGTQNGPYLFPESRRKRAGSSRFRNFPCENQKMFRVRHFSKRKIRKMGDKKISGAWLKKRGKRQKIVNKTAGEEILRRCTYPIPFHSPKGRKCSHSRMQNHPLRMGFWVKKKNCLAVYFFT